MNSVVLPIVWLLSSKQLIEKSRECHSHKPQPAPDTKRKRKWQKLTRTKQTNKCTRSTQTRSLLPKRGDKHVLSFLTHEPQHDKTNKMTSVRPAKTRIRCPVWSESSLCAQWVAKDLMFLHGDSEDSDQTGRMPRLIWVFAGRTCHIVGFVVTRLTLQTVFILLIIICVKYFVLVKICSKHF